MYHVYSNYLDNGQKIPFLFPKLEGVYNFSFKNHKMWSRGGELPSQTEGLEKTSKGGRAGFEWEEEFTR